MSSSTRTIPPGPWDAWIATVASPESAGAEALPAITGYRVIRRLGGGGMGEVYEVVDERLGVTVALKIVREDRASPAFTHRFHQEVRAMMGLDHPRIARVFGHSELAGRPYFTMRFVRGNTLADRLSAFRDRPREAVELLLKVIDAVDYLHRQGQVHRDLKPSNVLLDEAGEPYLSDFGLVKDLADAGAADDPAPTSPALADPTPPDADTRTLDPGGGHRTRTGARLGTYAYMSPEAARGEVRRVGPASDIWALGVILQELLTGWRPDRVGPPTGQVADPELNQIVRRCLAEDPVARYPSAAALAADLRAWLDRPRSLARARRRRLVVAAAVAVLAGALAIYLAMLRPSTRPDPVAEWRARARADLRAGRSVVLVDQEGNPAPGAQFVAGEVDSKMGHETDGWWAVRTTDAALVEFLDDPGVDAFEFSADVRPINPAVLSRVGLFVAHRRVAAVGGDWHLLLEQVYEENVWNFRREFPQGPSAPVPPGAIVVEANKVQVIGNTPRWEVRARAYQAGDRNALVGLIAQDVPADAPTVDGPWRHLVIRARPDGFAVSWAWGNAISVPGVPAAEQDRLQGVLGGQAVPSVRFAARGGLGVTVDNGPAAFRNVVVTPIP
jgi:hypothetical protein